MACILVRAVTIMSLIIRTIQLFEHPPFQKILLYSKHSNTHVWNYYSGLTKFTLFETDHMVLSDLTNTCYRDSPLRKVHCGFQTTVSISKKWQNDCYKEAWCSYIVQLRRYHFKNHECSLKWSFHRTGHMKSMVNSQFSTLASIPDMYGKLQNNINVRIYAIFMYMKPDWKPCAPN